MRPSRIALAAVALLPTALWLASLRSSSAAVVHGLLLVPSTVLTLAVLAVAVRARRWLAAAAALLVLCPALALSAVRAVRSARPVAAPREEPAAPALDVVSYNLLFNSRSPSAPAFLRSTGADVLCLQEVTPDWIRRLAPVLGAAYPHRALEPRYGAYGVAIYSRLPVSRPTRVEDGRRLAGQCVSISPGGVETVLCNVHLSSPAGFVGAGKPLLAGFEANARIRAAQWRLLREHVARTYPAARNLVVAGDFNTLDTEPLYREIRRGMVDAFAAAGSGRGATFPSELTSPVPLVRIDYVFASPGLTPRSAKVLPPAGSDHLGVRAVLGVPTGREARTEPHKPSSPLPHRGRGPG